MKAKIILGALAACVFSLPALAQPAPRDCAKARDPQRCESFQAAKEACKDKAGPGKKQCLQDAMPPVDCAKTRHPERCEAHQKAKELCKDKVGPDHRKCMRENMPKRGKRGSPKP